MPQLNIYLDEDTQQAAKRAAKRAGCSVSSWARQQLKVAADEGKLWPADYEQLFGSIQEGDLNRPTQRPFEDDIEREAL